MAAPSGCSQRANKARGVNPGCVSCRVDRLYSKGSPWKSKEIACNLVQLAMKQIAISPATKHLILPCKRVVAEERFGRTPPNVPVAFSWTETARKRA